MLLFELLYGIRKNGTLRMSGASALMHNNNAMNTKAEVKEAEKNKTFLILIFESSIYFLIFLDSLISNNFGYFRAINSFRRID